MARMMGAELAQSLAPRCSSVLEVHLPALDVSSPERASAEERAASLCARVEEEMCRAEVTCSQVVAIVSGVTVATLEAADLLWFRLTEVRCLSKMLSACC